MSTCALNHDSDSVVPTLKGIPIPEGVVYLWCSFCNGYVMEEEEI